MQCTGYKVAVYTCLVIITFVTTLIIYYLDGINVLSDAYHQWSGHDGAAIQCVRYRKQREGSFLHHNNDNTTSFNPIQNIPGVYSFTDVCIENLDEDSDNGRKIVVYNSSKNLTKQHIKVKDTRYVKHSYWILDFTSAPIPSHYKVHHERTAFFMQSTCEGNLHHIWEDVMIGLYGALKRTNRVGLENVLYFSSPALNRDSNCHNISRYAGLLEAIGIKQNLGWYQYEADRTCYSNAVFGPVFDIGNSLDVADLILDRYNASKPCEKNGITVVQRSSSRRILNIHELKDAITESFKNSTSTNKRSISASQTQQRHKLMPDVQVVHFEKLSLEQQVQIARCSKVLIGVQGAGLQWYSLMSFPALLLELTWTKWPPVYTPLAAGPPHCLHVRNIHCNNASINWQSYREHFRISIFTDNDKQKTLNRSLTVPFMDNHNVYKWADIIVDIRQILASLDHFKGQLFDTERRW